MKKKDLVIDYIKDNIYKGVWKPGNRILGECDIAQRLGVCRNTVRDALNELEKKDIIYKITGSGSYIKGKNSNKIMIVLDTSRSIYIRRHLFTKIADLIEMSPYDMEVAYINENKKIDYNNIGGIINLASDINYYRTSHIQNIPIINVLTFIFSETPGVIFDLASLYNNFFNLVKGHKDSIFIGFDLIGINMLLKRESIDNFVQDCDYLYMQGIQYIVSNLYNFIKIPEKIDFSGVEKHLDKAFSQINKTPYAIVFCDDVLYTRAYPLFEKYHHIFSNTKIITHSNGFNIETGPYKATKVEFNLDEAAQASVQLIISLMNRDPNTKRNIIIEPKIKE